MAKGIKSDITARVTDAKDSGSYQGGGGATATVSAPTNPTIREAESAYVKPYEAPFTEKFNASVGNTVRGALDKVISATDPDTYSGGANRVTPLSIPSLTNRVAEFAREKLGPMAVDRSTSPQFNAGYAYGKSNVNTFGTPSYGGGPNQEPRSVNPSGTRGYPASFRYLQGRLDSFMKSGGNLGAPSYPRGSSMYAPQPGARMEAVRMPSAPGGSTYTRSSDQTLTPPGQSLAFNQGALNGARGALYDYLNGRASGRGIETGRRANFGNAFDGSIFGFDANKK